MKTQLKHTELNQKLVKLFQSKKVVSINELYAALDPLSRMTVFRKLKILKYISSYSHSGKYYSLPEVAEFNDEGLWHINNTGFSKMGNLKNTLVYLVEKSSGGRSQNELQNILQISVHNTLLELIRTNKIARIKLEKMFIYVNYDDAKAKQQMKNRKTMKHGLQSSYSPDWIIIEIMAAIIRTSHLEIDPKIILLELSSRKITVPIETIIRVISDFDLKKTLD